MLDRGELLRLFTTLPDAGGFVLARRRQTLPSGIDIDLVDPSGMGGEPQRLVVVWRLVTIRQGCRVSWPHLHDTPVASRRQQPAVGKKMHVIDLSTVVGKRGQLVAA